MKLLNIKLETNISFRNYLKFKEILIKESIQSKTPCPPILINMKQTQNSQLIKFVIC
jgi:hypothetical protein